MERLEYLKVIEELRTMLANETQLRISCENELKAIKTKLDLITAAAAARQDLTNGANQLLTTLMATAEKTRLNNLGQMSPTANDYLMSIDTLACKMPFLYSNAPLISALQVPSLETQIPPFNNNMLISPPDSHQSTTFNPNGLDARTLNDDGSLLQPNWCANPLTLEQKEAATASSVSQRNLQAMLEAIRHLEGDA
jgi:hypothetical protein